MRPMVGLISALGGNQSPIAWERLRSQAVVEMGLNLRPISTETYIKLREVFRGRAGQNLAIILLIWYNLVVNHRISHDNFTFDSHPLIDF